MASKELPSVARPVDHERSISDGDVELEKKRRKTRRRRANKNRFKPYHSLSPEEKMALDAAETARSERRTRERLVTIYRMLPLFHFIHSSFSFALSWSLISSLR
ncbi:hypothetical protein Aduo_008891 [Ancylostoma duodenale]